MADEPIDPIAQDKLLNCSTRAQVTSYVTPPFRCPITRHSGPTPCQYPLCIEPRNIRYSAECQQLAVDAQMRGRVFKPVVGGTQPPLDPVRPAHYKQHASGVECIDIIEHMTFNLGTAIKYLWRAGQKPGETLETELRKAIWYIEREITRVNKT